MKHHFDNPENAKNNFKKNLESQKIEKNSYKNISKNPQDKTKQLIKHLENPEKKAQNR